MTDYATPTRVCTKCQKELPATLEFFWASNRNRVGLLPQCKECGTAAYIRRGGGQRLKARALGMEELAKLPGLEGVRRLYLGNLEGAARFALVDEQDYERVCNFKWCFSGGYARSYDAAEGTDRSFQPLHWLILGVPPKGMVVDHVNGDTLDNRRSNLRFASRHGNSRNRGNKAENAKRFKGVFKEGERYRARIWVEGKPIDVGYSLDEVEAARMYDAAARHFFGEFARLNLPDVAPLPVQIMHKKARQPRVVEKKRSPFVGISWHDSSKKWSAECKKDGRRFYLGVFPTDEEAARVRDAFIREHGLPLKLNFPDAI